MTLKMTPRTVRIRIYSSNVASYGQKLIQVERDAAVAAAEYSTCVHGYQCCQGRFCSHLLIRAVLLVSHGVNINSLTSTQLIPYCSSCQGNSW